uniref:Ig-like domain-containing protein n=1 Tax=Anolis carolinensis TaxID=28377 RepID=H9GUQ3_ANOCA
MPHSLWVVLTQSSGALKKPGESHEMICGTSGFTLSSTWMSWVRQKPGQGLEWLVYYYGTSSGYSYYSSSIQGRFTASKSGSNFYLHMTNLKIEDTAVYYCARDTEGLGLKEERARGNFDKDMSQFVSSAILTYGGEASAFIPFDLHSLLPPGALSEIQLIQSKSMAVSPGEMLRLNCKAKGFSVSDRIYLHWVRRPPGKRMVWMGFVDWTGITWRSIYAPFLQGRITISADTSTNSFSLQLRFLTAEDTATYYCCSALNRFEIHRMTMEWLGL